MARSTVEIEADIAGVRKAMASGVLTTRYEGVEKTFRSVEDLRLALASLQGELNTAQGLPSRTTQSFASFTRD